MTNRARRILVMDLSRHAHSPSYLRHLVEYFKGLDTDAHLDIVVWHTFLRCHPEVVALADACTNNRVRFLSIEPTDKDRKKAIETGSRNQLSVDFHQLLKQGLQSDYGAWYDWALFQKYAKLHAADILFIPHLDTYLPLIAAGAESRIPVAGIYFGPAFHYQDAGLGGEVPAHQALRERFTLTRVLNSPFLNTLFFLDSYAAARARRFVSGGKSRYLPDPVATSVVSGRRMLEVGRGEPSDRRIVFLVFGDLSRRKGVLELIQAVSSLPDDCCRRIALEFAGSIDDGFRRELDGKLESLGQSRSVELTTRYGYVPDAEMADWFSRADVVWTGYRSHRGMSGVLLLACAFKKPVLSTSHGLVGDMVKRHRLGLCVDLTSVYAIVHGVRAMINGDPQRFLDRKSARSLVARHTPHRFAKAIFDRLGA